jgi:hypothetical protein
LYPVDVNVKIDELIEIVESARAMPMSASCVINRAQVLDLLDDLRKGMPDEMDRAKRVLADRESVLADGRREADRLLERTRSERDSIIGNTDVSREARGAAERILAAARDEAEQIRTDADDYVDQKLANFEVVLTKTLQAVGRGRDKMRGTHSPMEELGRHVDEQDAAAEERKRSRSFSAEPSTGEFERPQFAEDGYTGDGYQDEGYQQEQPAYQEHGYAQDQGNQFDAYETQNFTAVAFTEAERPFQQHAHQHPDQPGYPVDEYQQQRGYDSGELPRYDTGEAPRYDSGETPRYDSGELPRYDSGELPQYGYEAAPAYDAGAAQGYGTGEFQNDQYGYDSGYGQQVPAQGGPVQVEVVQYGAVPEDTSYFDTGLIDVRQFQQEGYGR